MSRVFTNVRRFLRAEEGASLAEYGLLLALIAIICIGGMTILGANINGLFNLVSSTV
jgi:pilus assembly protein Flp/PilA